MLKKTVVVLLCCASWVGAADCPKGSSEGPGGRCYKDYMPVGSKSDSSQWVSSEKPPRGRMPSYQREGVNVVELPVQKWDSKTGGTEVSDQANYANAHPAKK